MKKKINKKYTQLQENGLLDANNFDQIENLKSFLLNIRDKNKVQKDIREYFILYFIFNK